MKDGLIRVGVVTPDTKVANPAYNADAAVRSARRAADAGVKVLVYPELTLTGYTAGDLFFQKALIDAAESELARFIKATRTLDMITFIGVPVPFCDKLYNCAAVVSHGELLALVPKTYLPCYAEFAEGRWFAPAPESICDMTFAGQQTVLGTDVLFECAELPSLRIAAEICEDLWATMSPSLFHARAGATVIANLSASTEMVGKPKKRLELVRTHSSKIKGAYLYADAGRGESGTDLLFSAHDVIASCGTVLRESTPFAAPLDAEETLSYCEIDLDYITRERARINSFDSDPTEPYEIVPFSLRYCDTEISCPPEKTPFVPEDPAELAEVADLVVTMQSRALADRLVRSHSKCAVIGVSGGLDSTLALLVAAKACDLLGRDRKTVLAVTMPCFGTSERTKGNAGKLADELGVSFRTVDIRASVEQHLRDIGHDIGKCDVVYENAQARERTQILMDLANAVGGLVVGTGDLSELALGFATYNGDQMSMYGVNAGVPKTLMRKIVSHLADLSEKEGKAQLAATLRDVVATPVSPELLPPEEGEIAQKTESIVGPYELNDYFLFHLVRLGESPAKILRLAAASFAGEYGEEEIRTCLKTFLRRFTRQQFKRSALPDGPKIGSVGLSPRGDLHLPSDLGENVLDDVPDEF